MNDDKGRLVAEMIRAARRGYAAGVIERLRSARPDLSAKLEGGALEFAGDTEMRLLHLATALEYQSPELFEDHLVWSKVAMAAQEFDADYLTESVQAIRAELAESLPQSASVVPSVLERGLTALAAEPVEPPTALADDLPHVDLLRRFVLAVLEGRQDDAVEVVVEALDSGVPIREVYDAILGPAQVEMGRMWQLGEIHTAEEHLASRTTERCLDALNARMPRPPEQANRVLLAAVGGEQHDIAVRFVADHFRMAGWQPITLGADMPAPDIAAAAADFAADLIAISASLALHVGAAAETVRAIRSHPRSAKLPILVGGRPFTLAEGLWRVVGADGCARNATEAVEVGARLVEGSAPVDS